MGTKVLGRSIIGPPMVGATETFISIGAFDTEQEAINCEKYINTKFCKALLSVYKCTQSSTSHVWKAVPMQDFSNKSDIDWSKPLRHIDMQLYRKYKLSFEEINFIEQQIDYRDDLPEEWLSRGKYQVVYAVNGDNRATRRAAARAERRATKRKNAS